jgi:hypothetical protein
MLLDFFTKDPTAEPWFSAASVSVEPRPSRAAIRITSLWPNPARGVLFAQIEVPRATGVGFDIVTVDGRVARRLPEVSLEPGRNLLRWTDLAGEGRLASGVYFLRVRVNDRTQSARGFVLVR